VAGFLGVDMLFASRHFDREIIILCVRWYLRFKLSFRDLVEMMAERGLPLAHTTIMRWVRHYAPEFERRWNRFARPAGASWRMDETYIKVRGEWVYLYRAVDAAGPDEDCAEFCALAHLLRHWETFCEHDRELAFHQMPFAH
jgi:putative transposase